MTFQSNHGDYFSGTYIPFGCNITAIARGETTTVTTSVNHGFVVGNQVQFVIPKQWGISQLNNKTGYVLATTSNTITVNINSLFYDAFVTPVVVPPAVIDNAQVMPIGDANTGYVTANVNQPVLQIPGTFRNTYP